MNERLSTFTLAVDDALREESDEGGVLTKVKSAMAALVARDDWLPDEFAQPHPVHYQQYLLYLDPQDRYSVVSFVWGPGQFTPIHDHTIWGVIGMLRGSERSEGFRLVEGGIESTGAPDLLMPSDVAAVSPRIGDIHRVSNALNDRTSISIHAYGGNIGSRVRHVFDEKTGAPKLFRSGYANRTSTS
ncbi:MAG TPA: cysteine dioxygenase [Burkholderiaceae bacterium]|nr:cysteine dioxygenase [Burkholderiaceae bacterium]